MSLPEALKLLPLLQTMRQDSPLWQGPYGEGKQSGATQGLLGRYLVCKERFRLQTIEGLKASERWNHRLGYGNMWHTCEEAWASGGDELAERELGNCTLWEQRLADYAIEQLRDWPFQREEIEKWYNVCLRQFPEYVKFWSRRPERKRRTPLLQEQIFDVLYHLPSGRTVRLRGKWDGVQEDNGLWLMEHKTKGDIDEQQIKRQLTFDLQTMLYLVALQERLAEDHAGNSLFGFDAGNNIVGILYNVVRRPLSGGKGTIIQHKATAGAKCTKCKGEGRFVAKKTQMVMACPKCRGVGRTGGKPTESSEDYYDRMAQYIKDEPETFFMRWEVGVTAGDIERFRRETLDPVLENVCDDYEWWAYCKAERVSPFTGETDEGSHRHRCDVFDHHHPRHFRMPFGIQSGLLDGGMTDIDEYLASGSLAGLQRTDDLFPELKE